MTSVISGISSTRVFAALRLRGSWPIPRFASACTPGGRGCAGSRMATASVFGGRRSSRTSTTLPARGRRLRLREDCHFTARSGVGAADNCWCSTTSTDGTVVAASRGATPAPVMGPTPAPVMGSPPRVHHPRCRCRCSRRRSCQPFSKAATRSVLPGLRAVRLSGTRPVSLGAGVRGQPRAHGPVAARFLRPMSSRSARRQSTRRRSRRRRQS